MENGESIEGLMKLKCVLVSCGEPRSLLQTAASDFQNKASGVGEGFETVGEGLCCA